MESLEQLQTRHRKEQRDLQARITQKKKGATKKTRKGVNTECEGLERSLKERQEQEIAELDNGSTAVSEEPGRELNLPDEAIRQSAPDDSAKEAVNGTAEEVRITNISDTSKIEEVEGRKRNRQKERLARRAAEQEAAALEAEAEAAKLPNWKQQEQAVMLKIFEKHNLVEKAIAPDGHCLFSAVADQLADVGIPLSGDGEMEAVDRKYKIVRKEAARYMEGHPDEFTAFLEEPLPSYVHKIRDTAEWGGQLELIALAKSYNIAICVIQDGRIDRFEPTDGGTQEAANIWLAYYRHGYGLGEHYNSLRKAP